MGATNPGITEFAIFFETFGSYLLAGLLLILTIMLCFYLKKKYKIRRLFKRRMKARQ